jgi:hypothetical protein
MQISNFQAISWRKQVTFDEMIMISALYQTYTRTDGLMSHGIPVMKFSSMNFVIILKTALVMLLLAWSPQVCHILIPLILSLIG